MAEQTFWQRCLAHFSYSAAPVEVALPIDKLTCALGRSKKDAYNPVVLVSCGSFNPPTNMHLRMFELAKDHLTQAGYDVWGGYLSPVNDAYSKKGLASSGDRIAMSQAAARASDIIMVDTWEASQPEYQRSLHVLRSVQERLSAAMHGRTSSEQHKAEAPAKAMLLCGSDLVESFFQPGVWKPEQVRAIFEEHGVVCISRNAQSLQSSWASHEGLKEFQDKLHCIEDPVANEISSTKVRGLLHQGKSAKYLTPDLVLQYIKDHKLYNKA